MTYRLSHEAFAGSHEAGHAGGSVVRRRALLGSAVIVSPAIASPLQRTRQMPIWRASTARL